MLLQVAQALASRAPVLYATGEESTAQVALRARRLGGAYERVQLLAETDLDTVLALAEQQRPALLVVDSIQTMALAAVPNAAGAVTQLRECTAALVRFAKASGTAVLIVGHVTKDGAIAGPRMLEHLVDTVLYFERDAGSRFRRVRAAKNRFGAANELGFFLMQDTGLKEVKNPAAIFLSRAPQPVVGSLVMVTRDGTRPLLVEVQGLVDPSRLGAPRRVAQGIDAGRLGHGAGGAAPAWRRVAAGTRCVRERGGRPRHRRAGLGPAGGAGAGFQPARFRAAAGPGGVRRAGPDRRGAAGDLRRGTHPRSGQAGLQARAGAGSQPAARRAWRASRCAAWRASRRRWRACSADGRHGSTL